MEQQREDDWVVRADDNGRAMTLRLPSALATALRTFIGTGALPRCDHCSAAIPAGRSAAHAQLAEAFGVAAAAGADGVPLFFPVPCGHGVAEQVATSDPLELQLSTRVACCAACACALLGQTWGRLHPAVALVAAKLGVPMASEQAPPRCLIDAVRAEGGDAAVDAMMAQFNFGPRATGDVPPLLAVEVVPPFTCVAHHPLIRTNAHSFEPTTGRFNAPPPPPPPPQDADHAMQDAPRAAAAGGGRRRPAAGAASAAPPRAASGLMRFSMGGN